MPCSLLSLQTSVDKEDFTCVEIYFSTQERRLAWSVWKPQRALVWKGRYDNESWWWRARNEDKGVQSPSNVTKQQKRFPRKGRWNSANQRWCSGNHKTDVRELARLTGEKINRGTGPVDLLIRIDHASLHTGETKQSGHLVRETHLSDG